MIVKRVYYWKWIVFLHWLPNILPFSFFKLFLIYESSILYTNCQVSTIKIISVKIEKLNEKLSNCLIVMLMPLRHVLLHKLKVFFKIHICRMNWPFHFFFVRRFNRILNRPFFSFLPHLLLQIRKYWWSSCLQECYYHQ